MKTKSAVTRKKGMMWALLFVVTLLATQATNAQSRPSRFDKPRYRVDVCMSGRRACTILYKKRTARAKHRFEFLTTRYTYRPMAETDPVVKPRN